MNILKKNTALFLVILFSCSINEENLEISQTDEFYERVNYIINSPSVYESVVPENINPYEIVIDLQIPSSEKSSKTQESTSESQNAPEEIKNAKESFKDLSFRLIEESKVISHESFQKLAYSIELQVFESNLLLVEKEFILRQLAVLKLFSDIKYQKLSIENGRIACDSQFECDLLACVDAKITDAFESASDTWLETAILIYDMPVLVPVFIASCTYSLLSE